MTSRRIRGLLVATGVVGGVKIAREILVARNRKRAPEIVAGHGEASTLKR